MMNKVLILTASTGAGHNQAAKSLQFKYEQAGHKVKIVDMLKETHRAYHKLIGDGYEYVAAHMPELYKAMYDVADMKTFNKLTNRYGLPGVNLKLERIIKKYQPDVIVGTHAFAVGIVSSLKRKHEIDAKFISVVTDFKAHFAYYSPLVDAYVVGSEYTKRSLVSKGVPADKVYAYGIPINLAFFDKKEMLLQEKTDEKFNVLVMAGSMGVSKIAEVIEEVVTSSAYQVRIVCGKNESLLETIHKMYKEYIDNERVIVYGFTREVPRLMAEADVLITKPGGLTTTEALHKKVPMIIPFAIPGQEEENAEFLEEQGAALRGSTSDAVGRCVEILYKERGLHNRMVRQIEKITKNYSIDSIVDLSDNLVFDSLKSTGTSNYRSSERLYI